MAYLRNKNGRNYEIISSRPSKHYKGHNDYLVRIGDSVTVARGWKPKNGEWETSTFMGFIGSDKRELAKAKKAFKERKENK